MREPTPNEGNSCLSQLVAKESPPLGQKKEEMNFLAAKDILRARAGFVGAAK